MRPETLRQSGPTRTLNTGMPYRFVRDRPLLVGFLESRGEQVDLRLHFASSPVRSQRFEKFGGKWQFPVARVLSLVYVDDHALAVDVGEFQPRGFSSPETSGVQKQQDRSVANVGCGRNQLLDFFRAEYDGKLLWHSGELHIVKFGI